MLLLTFFVSILYSNLEKRTAGFDLFFILTFFSLFMIWLKPQALQLNKVNEALTVSPSLIMLKQLAINKEDIVKSRLIIQLIYSIPFQTILLICLYPLTPAFQEILSIPVYIAFSII